MLDAKPVKHGKNVLVTIDEVASTQAMREFASDYQILIRKDLPVCLPRPARDVRQEAGLSTNQFNPYRDRLVKKSVVDSRTCDRVRFFLPLFE